jgi:uncharacterized protein YbjT (DUF2867 family)
VSSILDDGERAPNSRLRDVLLLTGATGLVGSAVLRRLTARAERVRCLVRDPRRLRVQLAIGDLSDPASWRHALRGVKTVVHLAATERDQPRATIESPGRPRSRPGTRRSC